MSGQHNYSKILIEDLGFSFPEGKRSEDFQNKYIPKESLTCGLVKFMVERSCLDIAYNIISEIAPWCKITPLPYFKKKYYSALQKSKKKGANNILLCDIGVLEENNDESPYKKAKLDDNVTDYQKLYHDLQEKYCVLEAEKESLELNVKQLETSIIGLKKQLLSQNRKAAALKGSQTRIKKALSFPTAPTDAKIDLGTEIISLQSQNIKTKNMQVFLGHRMKRDDITSEFKSLKSSHRRFYCDLGEQCQKPASLLVPKWCKERSTHAFEIFDFIAAGNREGCSNQDRISLLASHFKSNPGNFDVISQHLKKSLFTPLNTIQCIQLQSLLQLSTFKFRLLRVFLNNMDIKLFASENKMRKLRDHLLLYVKGNSKCGTTDLYETHGSQTSSKIPYYRVINLCLFVEDICKRSSLKHDPEFGGDIWLMISGDKGGDSMKFHLEVLNCTKVGSVDNVHTFCFYKGSDRDEDMLKMFNVYHKEFKAMNSKEFQVFGRNIRLFLGGDFKFLCAILGHQGCAASYPSFKDDVLLTHLREHEGKPHTPNDCSFIKDRIIQDSIGAAQENIAAGLENVKKSGKWHMSMVKIPLFPISSYLQVAPPILHINLGICLKLFNLLLNFVRKLDTEEGGHIFDYDVAQKQFQYSERLIEIQNEVSSLAREYIDFKNIEDRLKHVGNKVKLDELAIACYVNKTSKDSDFECCEPIHDCIVTAYDEDALEVQCEVCHRWKHVICECLVKTQESLEILPNYICTKCRQPPVDRSILIKDQLEIVEDQQNEFILEEDEMKRKLENITNEVNKNVGDREINLNEKLKMMDVHREAYHGNVFVGHHCKKLLKNHEDLLTVISDKSEDYERFREVFSTFGEAQSYLHRKEFLEEDIKTVEMLCYKFGEVYPAAFPGESISPKMHEYIFHVPKFLAKHKTVGLCSEEEGESLHARFNAEMRALGAVRDPSLQMQLLQERQELRSMCDKSLFDRKPRVCRKCLGQGIKSFLKVVGKRQICPGCA